MGWQVKITPYHLDQTWAFVDDGSLPPPRIEVYAIGATVQEAVDGNGYYQP